MKRPRLRLTGGSLLHQLFDGFVFVKLVQGVLEVGVGTVVLFNPHLVSQFLLRLTRGEFLEDRADVIASYLRHTALSLTHSTQLFIGTYLFLWGFIKLVMALGLLFERRWSYDFALYALGAFIVYQVYRVSHTHSLFLFTIILLDIATLYLVYVERKRKHSALGA